MDTIIFVQMKGFKIIDIIKVVFGNILLELHFNIERFEEKFSFALSVSDNGEAILFSQKMEWTLPNDIKYETYKVIPVDKKNDELTKLINNEIKDIQFGIGKTLDTFKSVIYYAKIITDKNNFLFFNNGDEGSYSFDKIDEILANDIYGYEWTEKLPMI